MIEIGKKQIGISGFAIRLFAVIFMAAGAAGYLLGYGYDWLESFGWTSFSMFAFLLAEGVAHTTDKVLYFRRFLLFAIISEIIFDYMRVRKFIYWPISSAMATLFTGFIILLILSYVKKRFENLVLDMILIAVLGYIAYRFTNYYNFEFGGFGIVIILMFYVARQVSYPKLLQLIVIFYISFYLTKNVVLYVTIFGLQYPIAPELYSLLSLPIIWMYDDERGPNMLWIQILQYLVYPFTLAVMLFFRHFY